MSALHTTLLRMADGVTDEYKSVLMRLDADSATKIADGLLAWAVGASALEPLKSAIRAITVDMPDGSPNGHAESLIDPISDAILQHDFDALGELWPEFLTALADDTGALRRAADVAFAEDFSKPKPSEQNGCDHKFVDSKRCMKCGWTPPARSAR
jgi:hypothetical protein